MNSLVVVRLKERKNDLLEKKAIRVSAAMIQKLGNNILSAIIIGNCERHFLLGLYFLVFIWGHKDNLNSALGIMEIFKYKKKNLFSLRLSSLGVSINMTHNDLQKK